MARFAVPKVVRFTPAQETKLRDMATTLGWPVNEVLRTLVDNAEVVSVSVLAPVAQLNEKDGVSLVEAENAVFA